MLQQTILRTLLFSATVAAFSSCSIMRETDKVEYNFSEGNNNRKLVFSIPGGYVSETHNRDENGLLIRTFHYKDGAEFFVACKDQETNPVISVKHSAGTASELTSKVGEEGTGQNMNGTAWRRTIRDCFIIGYDFVKPDSAKMFDQAIQSLKLRRG